MTKSLYFSIGLLPRTVKGLIRVGMRGSLIPTLAFLVTSLITMTAMADADSQSFVVATPQDTAPVSNSPGWRVDIGEVYQFVRFMSNYEYQGSQLPSQDKTYSVLRIGDVTVVSASKNFVPVEQKDLASAAMRYGEEVARAQKSAPASSLNGVQLSRTDRRNMLYFLRSQNLISTIAAGEEMQTIKLSAFIKRRAKRNGFEISKRKSTNSLHSLTLRSRV